MAVEQDSAVIPYLKATLRACADESEGRVTFTVIEDDYILASTGIGQDPRLTGFDLVIQNPPYAKLAVSSPLRTAVRSACIDTPNLYAAFLALAAAALLEGGQLVGITPRSFCNGPYFGAFRRHLLDQVALDRVHVFDSRSTVFADTGVLQENIIFAATKRGARSRVVLSVSAGHEDAPSAREVAYDDVVHRDDPHQFIRITSNERDTEIAERMLAAPSTLVDLDVTVSTGRVVDFRSRECLRTDGDESALPLIYPANLREGVVSWPREIRKPQWFAPLTDRDLRMVMPQGWYCVVKRFSAKEERRRIVAAVWSPEQTPGAVAFENHVNVFHAGGAGLDRDLAFGLSLWLNSSLVDKFFRTFSGHTQVNATDLRTLRFPDERALRELGSRAAGTLPAQEEIDRLVDGVLDLVEATA